MIIYKKCTIFETPNKFGKWVWNYITIGMDLPTLLKKQGFTEDYEITKHFYLGLFGFFQIVQE